MSFTLVDSSQAARQACQSLSASYHLFLDCEGRDLGCEDGVLRLITIGTALAREVFLFDVQALGRDDLQPVLDLLADTHSLKIVWDGRMDSVELRRSFGVRIGLVLDLQVADVQARATRAFRDAAGGKNFLHSGHPLFFARKLDSAGVHALTPLKSVREAHGMPAGAAKLASNSNSKQKTMSHDKRLTTPLPTGYLKSAARDVLELVYVYALFRSRGYVGTSTKPQPDLLAASTRYVHIHAAPPPRENPYLGSNLMPMEILNAPSPGAATSQCDKCRRMLTAASFTYREGNATKKKKAGATGGQLHTSCKVCYLLDAREKARPQKKPKIKPATGIPPPGGLPGFVPQAAPRDIGPADAGGRDSGGYADFFPDIGREQFEEFYLKRSF